MVKREDNMAKGKDKYPSNAYEYTDWLYTSNRLTAEEHSKLKAYLLQLEEAAAIDALVEEGILTVEGC